MVQHICFFCNAEIGKGNNMSADEMEDISHGLCASCVPKFMAGHGCKFAEFLDRQAVPIFVVGDNGRILGANNEGLDLVDKAADAIQGQLGGEVFECRHASEPGGCGQTIHCKSCTIRNSVTKTAQTGEPCIRVEAYMDLGNIIQDHTVRFLISTEKVIDVVLLRIDEVEDDNRASSASSPSAA